MLSKKNIYSISVFFFLISLSLKTYCTDGDCGQFGSGFFCLIFGGVGLLGGGAFVAWLANPLLFAAWIFNPRKPVLSAVLSGLAILFALSFLFFDKIMKDEAGNYGEITGYHLGYWFWLMSMVVFFFGTLFFMYSSKKEPKRITSR